ncbi:MAG: A/G-specific adenine glycosylase [Clostridiales bacterium]|nr:A/G-specific adenine glycosylase [Clostridiales bacterium]
MDWIAPLTEWFLQNARDLPWRRTNDAYAVWISEIMLQQTRVTAAIPYYERFLGELPNVAALANADDDRLHKLWEGLGYYSRARNLKRAAIEIVERFSGSMPRRYEELLTLPGIGEYTAGAIASIAFHEAVPAVDGNVLRVWARLTADGRDIRDPAYKKEVRAALLPLIPAGAPGVFNAALMELGALLCLPNGAPKCGLCPVRAWCEAYRQGKTAELPVLSAKKARRVETKTVFALSIAQGLLGFRRPVSGLLAGLWQLPEAAGKLTDAEAAAWLGERGILPVGELRFYERKHIFTHVEWHMRVCAADVSIGQLPEGWIVLDESHALPTAYRVCL